MKEVQRLRQESPQPLRARSASMVAELPSCAEARTPPIGRKQRHGALEPSDAPILKLLLVGESGVGKSALLTRYVDDDFSPSFITTIGIDFKSKHITLESDGTTRLRLQIWDTAGQERFRTITSAYYRGAQGVLLVYDVTNRDSFKRVAEHWMQEVEQRTADTRPLLFLVGNKCDLATARVVGAAEGRDLATARGYFFFEASACTGTGVGTLFMEAAERVYRATVHKPSPPSAAAPSAPSPVVALAAEPTSVTAVADAPKKSCC